MQQVYLSSHNAQQRGFTLIELIMVIVMLGILAVFAAPRMFNTGDFYARGFHDETLALLRYAQKTAIAQRRMVCVTFDLASTPNNAYLTLYDPLNATAVANNGCNVNLTGPKGESPAKVEARSGVMFSSATNFNFDGLGQPVNSARVPLATNSTVQVATASGNISKTVTVESLTGYVHE